MSKCFMVEIAVPEELLGKLYELADSDNSALEPFILKVLQEHVEVEEVLQGLTPDELMPLIASQYAGTLEVGAGYEA